jgi:hypothetical protein
MRPTRHPPEVSLLLHLLADKLLRLCAIVKFVDQEQPRKNEVRDFDLKKKSQKS